MTTSNAAAAPSTTSFADLGLRAEILAALSELGFAQPTPVQRDVIPLALKRQDLLVQSQTGTGKTAAFILPMAQGLIDLKQNNVQALVLDPTRELALQVSAEAAKLAKNLPLRVATLYGGTNIQAQISTLKRGVHLVCGTPGRVLDHLRRGTLQTSAIRVVVLDECDQMLSMGFLEDITAIFDELPKTRQTLLFSATIPATIERFAARILQKPQRVSLSSDAVGARAIDHAYYLVAMGDRLRHLKSVLKQEKPEYAVVFCNTREETARVTQYLQQEGFHADGISGDVTQRERERVMQSIKDGDLNILVATDVAARGIDIPDLSHVVNFSFPESPDIYVHRTGRTGRAGRSGIALSLVSAKEIGALSQLRLIHKIYPEERELPGEESAAQHEGRQMQELRHRLTASQATPDARHLVRRILTCPDGIELLAKSVHHALAGAVERPKNPS